MVFPCARKAGGRAFSEDVVGRLQIAGFEKTGKFLLAERAVFGRLERIDGRDIGLGRNIKIGEVKRSIDDQSA